DERQTRYRVGLQYHF
ncbi:hypothetical protein JI643_003874, partial [Salmonella enterica]|nr:hypothetical protein [Salmonella enterica]EGX4513861.1 hypothetical protein [Salmonella enterica]EGY9079832.1 hypothetical protein [Salmonella enterica]